MGSAACSVSTVPWERVGSDGIGQDGAGIGQMCSRYFILVQAMLRIIQRHLEILPGESPATSTMGREHEAVPQVHWLWPGGIITGVFTHRIPPYMGTSALLLSRQHCDSIPGAGDPAWATINGTARHSCTEGLVGGCLVLWGAETCPPRVTLRTVSHDAVSLHALPWTPTLHLLYRLWARSLGEEESVRWC